MMRLLLFIYPDSYPDMSGYITLIQSILKET